MSGQLVSYCRAVPKINTMLNLSCIKKLKSTSILNVIHSESHTLKESARFPIQKTIWLIALI